MDRETIVCKVIDPPLACSINFAYVFNIFQEIAVCLYIKILEHRKCSL